MTSPRLIAVLSFSAACLMMATAAGSDTAYAQTAENGTGAAASPSLTLGGLTLDTGGPLSLAEDQPRLYLGLAPTQRSLPLASQPLQPGSMGDADIGDGLGTRLTIGQPLGVDFLGGAVDLQAAATVENSANREAYGLSLSLGSMAESPAGPPSDLRVGLTYGSEPEAGEHGVILDFSYTF